MPSALQLSVAGSCRGTVVSMGCSIIRGEFDAGVLHEMEERKKLILFNILRLEKLYNKKKLKFIMAFKFYFIFPFYTISFSFQSRVIPAIAVVLFSTETNVAVENHFT